jgi:4-amino-4-deoxy-L-arabinose transferase-like glycosyltransferase
MITPFLSQRDLAQQDQLFFQRPIGRLFLLSFLFIAAFGIRLYHLNEPPLDFHPTRQYWSAHIARYYYLEATPLIPESRKEVARINREISGVLEPPIMPFLASIAYRLAGEENLWFPRFFSVLFWLIGGVFLYLLAKDLISEDAALCTTAFYLFLPYGVSASRSFQPDPLMLMVGLASIFAIVQNHLQPSRERLIIAATLSALAILIKPTILFVIFGAFVSLAIFKQGLHNIVASSNNIVFAVVSLLPAIIYYGMGIDTTRNIKLTFLLHLYGDPFFWKSWFNLIETVIGQTALLLALVGVLMFRDGWQKALLVGLWIGYLIFGLVFNYHIHTHDYYHLQLIPVVALSLGSLGALILDGLRRSSTRWYWHLAIAGILIMAVLLSIRKTAWSLSHPEFKSHVRIAKEIGEAVNHNSRTIFIAKFYGEPLRYYGEFAGLSWPNADDVRQEQLVGRATISVEERLRTLMSKYSAEYFVVADFEEFEAQQDLKQFLIRRFPLVAESSHYLIFDLTSDSKR